MKIKCNWNLLWVLKCKQLWQQSFGIPRRFCWLITWPVGPQSQLHTILRLKHNSEGRSKTNDGKADKKVFLFIPQKCSSKDNSSDPRPAEEVLIGCFQKSLILRLRLSLRPQLKQHLGERRFANEQDFKEERMAISMMLDWNNCYHGIKKILKGMEIM